MGISRTRVAAAACSIILSGCVSQPPSEDLRAYPVVYMPLSIIRPEGMVDDKYVEIPVALPKSDKECLAAGWQFAQEGRLEIAMGAMTRVIERNRDSEDRDHQILAADGFVKRGILRLTRGDVRGAIADYTCAIDRVPDHWEAFFHRWQAFRLVGELENADRDRATGMKLNPRVFEIEYSFDGGVI